MEQEKKNIQDNDKKDKNISKDLNQQEFEIPETERKSNDLTANEQQGEIKRSSTGGLHTGKTSSTTTGDQIRGGDETYTNVNREKSTSNKENENNDNREENIGIGADLGHVENENKKRRGADNMIDDNDEDTDTGTGKSGIDENEEGLK